MASFTVICDKCGSKDVWIASGNEGDYEVICEQCGSSGSRINGDLLVNGE